jgi:hypothetical protein
VVVSMLRLVTGPMVWDILRAICDMPAFARVLESREKKDPTPGNSSSDDGSPGSPQDTSPPTAT